MRKAVFCGMALAGLLCVLPALRGQTAPASASSVADPKAVLRDAGRAYYNLHNRGMASFQCDIEPDWQLALAGMAKSNPDAAGNVLKLVEQLHFTMTIASDDTLKVTHTGLESVTDPTVSDGLNQIYGGIEQMVTGTFQTWNLFALKAPFPDPDSDYSLTRVGPGYQLKYKEEGADIVTTFGKNFAIDTMKVTLPALDSTLKPALTSTPEGLLLTGYDGTYNIQNADGPLQLHAHLEYTKVQGLEMLSRLAVNGTSGSAPFSAALGFTNCKATMK
jgi:hypothetical protein